MVRKPEQDALQADGDQGEYNRPDSCLDIVGDTGLLCELIILPPVVVTVDEWPG